MYLIIVLFLKTFSPLVLLEPTYHQNPFLRIRPRDLLFTHYDWEKKPTKTLHKYAINQETQCESEPQDKESTNRKATLYSKARATTLTVCKLTAKSSEKKVNCSQVLTGNKNSLDHESFYQMNKEGLLLLNPEDRKYRLQWKKNNRKKGTNRKIVSF